MTATKQPEPLPPLAKKAARSGMGRLQENGPLSWITCQLSAPAIETHAR